MDEWLTTGMNKWMPVSGDCRKSPIFLLSRPMSPGRNWGAGIGLQTLQWKWGVHTWPQTTRGRWVWTPLEPGEGVNSRPCLGDHSSHPSLPGLSGLPVNPHPQSKASSLFLLSSSYLIFTSTFLFFKYTKVVPTSGPLCLLFPLSGTSFPKSWLIHSSQVSAKNLILSAALPDHPNWNSHLLAPAVPFQSHYPASLPFSETFMFVSLLWSQLSPQCPAQSLAWSKCSESSRSSGSEPCSTRDLILVMLYFPL